MEAEFIIKSIMGLIAILAVLIFLLFYNPNKNKKKAYRSNSTQKDDLTGLKLLISILKNTKSTTNELSESLKLIIKDYGKIDNKIGSQPHPDFHIYKDIIFTICVHPNTNKDMILNFDRELERLNPEYKKNINDVLAKALNSRRA